MYLFFGEGDLHPVCMSNKLPGMHLQAGLDVVQDLILWVQYLETSSTEDWMSFLNSCLRVEVETPYQRANRDIFRRIRIDEEYTRVTKLTAL